MKKIISAVLIAAMIVFVMPSGKTALAEVSEFKLNYNVESALLLEHGTGRVIYSYNETKHVPIASVTKIMTLILGFEAVENGVFTYETKLTVSSEAAAMGGSQVFLNAGETVSVADIFKAIIVASANDACVVLAEAVAGSVTQFVTVMNKRASELGMADTKFVNCTGLPDVGYYSCARDVGIMSFELLKHKDYFNWSTIWLGSMDNIQNKTMITNTNKLIRFYDGCDGLKTGFTNDAMHCISATACKNGVRFIAVVLGARSSDDRFSLAKELLNYGFANYKSVPIVKKGNKFDGSTDIVVKNGEVDYINGVAASDLSELCEITEKPNYTITSVPDKVIKAPVAEGDKIGYFTVYRGDVEVGRIDMLADRSVCKAGYGNYIKKFFQRWFCQPECLTI